MNKKLPFLTLFNVHLTFTPLCVLSYLILIPPLAWVGTNFFALDLFTAFITSVIIIVLMFISENIHQLGHAWAARSVGYPMIGIHHFAWFSFCIYPKDEPELAPQIHIKRALGGFWINLLLGLILFALAYGVAASGAVTFILTLTALWNFFVLGLGALLPIDYKGFTVDGGTILKYWRVLRSQKSEVRSQKKISDK